MPRVLISLGVPITLVVGEVYALPARTVNFQAQGGTIEVSNDATTWVATTGQEVQAAFIRTTVANSLFMAKSWH